MEKLSAEEVKKRKKASDREYYLKNKEHLIKKATNRNQSNRKKHRKYDRKWRAKNPDASRRSYLKRTYGISLLEYEEKKLIQANQCAICEEKAERLVVDHDHITDAVRDLLCTTCNAGLGQFKDDPNLLNRAIDYLKKWNQQETKKEDSSQDIQPIRMAGLEKRLSETISLRRKRLT